jgi:hypothetical protein
MPKIPPPEGPAAAVLPAPPGAHGAPPADDDADAPPAPAPWQAAVIRVSVVVAVWLGY